MQASFKKILSWDKAIVFGVPLKIIDETKFDPNAIQFVQEKSFHIVQQKNDILGSVSDLQKYSPANLLSIDGSDHQYDNFNLYISKVSEWLSDKL